ncbi:hypothetical protein ABZ960_43710 [Streptomyces pseudovenezuelae]|uniref:hypothetical protein n=1 Tax=Streptomyces pseudovenezuelae TaxID=67350 RepID=UPI0034A16CF3
MPDIAFTDVAPVVPVRDLDAALERYRRLGFTARAHDGPQAYGFVEGRFVEPSDTPYGLREFTYVDADGTAHRVGSPAGS